jgi:hypothetical protein
MIDYLELDIRREARGQTDTTLQLMRGMVPQPGPRVAKCLFWAPSIVESDNGPVHLINSGAALPWPFITSAGADERNHVALFWRYPVLMSWVAHNEAALRSEMSKLKMDYFSSWIYWALRDFKEEHDQGVVYEIPDDWSVAKTLRRHLTGTARRLATQ